MEADSKKNATVLKEQFIVSSVAEPSTLKTTAVEETTKQNVQTHESECNIKNSGKAESNSNSVSTKIDKALRFAL